MTPGVHAATIPVQASATGSILEERDGARYPTITTTYTTTNPLGELHDSFSFSSYYSTIVGHRKASVGYVVFDLSDVADDMQSVRLEMDLAYGSNSNPNLTIHALDPATALNLMANPVGTQSDSYNPSVDGNNESPLYLQLQNQYNAIGTGAQLGALSQSGPLSGIYSVDLTVTTLGLVNATDGFLAMGFTWTHEAHEGSLVFSDLLAFNADPRLILGDSVSAVPLPAAAWLFGSALMSLMGMARRHRT